MELTPRCAQLLSGTVATEHDMRDLLSDLIEARKSQKAVAGDLGISGAYLGDVLRGKRAIGAGMAEKLGWEKVTVFVRK